MNDDLSELSYAANRERQTDSVDVETNTNTTSLTSQTYQCIHDMIMRGELPPGQKLKIENLRKTLRAGASPIREALSLLTSDHLVERIDQRGFRVALVSGEAFRELLKTRCWVEERALRESIEHGDAQWEENIVLANHRLNRTPRSIGEKSYIANSEWEPQHKKLHMALLSACGSSILLKFCGQLYDQNIRYRNLSGTVAYSTRNTNDEHKHIVKLVLERNADEAVKALVNHYNKTGQFLNKQLK
jgi:DNA-binding GntR family transcriptional regulator